MKTVGELLKTARQKKHLSIDQIVHKTKIQSQFITALEKDDYDHLPESAFVKGFISNYAKAIDKDPQAILAVFRRDFSEDARGKVIPRGLAKPINQPRFQWTPRTTTIASFTAILTLFSIYLIIQFRLLSGVPNLELTSPQENQTVSSLVTIEGTTHPQATVTINSKPIEVNPEGKFTETIDLTPGEHTITVEAQSRTDKTTTIQRTVVVE